MDTLNVNVNDHHYPIYIGSGIYNKMNEYINDGYSRILIITDSNVEKLYLNNVKEYLNSAVIDAYVIPAGEQSKNIDIFYKIHSKLITSGFDRNSLIIALGGGMVGDLAGFVAATFMRGIDFIQVPTTILAHDSSVGGKVAINHELGKNMIGQFYHPQSVIYDLSFLKSLPQKQVRSGYAELVKEAMIADMTFLNRVLTRKLDSIDLSAIQDDIVNGILIKKEIVENDEREAGLRKHLNLGHTLGHALEIESDYGITHGEAVAIGLLFAVYISEIECGKSLYFKELNEWLIMNGYPLALSHLDVNKIISLMKRDKKSKNKQVQMTLLKDIGHPYVQAINDNILRDYLNSFLEHGSDINEEQGASFSK